jgi:tRNA pseudouridine38-40 synthase
VEVGRGKMPLNDVKKFIHTKSDEPAKLTAPPSGLFLERVYYKGDMWLKDMKPMMEISTGRKGYSVKQREMQDTEQPIKGMNH